MIANITLTDVIWFYNGAHFIMYRHVNEQNMRFWGTSKPEFYEEDHIIVRKLYCGQHWVMNPFTPWYYRSHFL